MNELKFYEEGSVTIGMKQYLDQLRKIYPEAKNYEDVLWYVFFELGKIYNHGTPDGCPLKSKRSWSKIRFRLVGAYAPQKIEWNSKTIKLSTEEDNK
jgi:hypothetical protein